MYLSESMRFLKLSESTALGGIPRRGDNQRGRAIIVLWISPVFPESAKSAEILIRCDNLWMSELRSQNRNYTLSNCHKTCGALSEIPRRCRWQSEDGRTLYSENTSCIHFLKLLQSGAPSGIPSRRGSLQINWRIWLGMLPFLRFLGRTQGGGIARKDRTIMQLGIPRNHRAIRDSQKLGQSADRPAYVGIPGKRWVKGKISIFPELLNIAVRRRLNTMSNSLAQQGFAFNFGLRDQPFTTITFLAN